jgi:hypothetical protein
MEGDKITEHTVIRTDAKTLLTILGGILVLASLVWANRSHIESLLHTEQQLTIQVERLEEQIRMLELELAKVNATREERERQQQQPPRK